MGEPPLAPERDEHDQQWHRDRHGRRQPAPQPPPDAVRPAVAVPTRAAGPRPRLARPRPRLARLARSRRRLARRHSRPGEHHAPEGTRPHPGPMPAPMPTGAAALRAASCARVNVPSRARTCPCDTFARATHVARTEDSRAQDAPGGGRAAGGRGGAGIVGGRMAVVSPPAEGVAATAPAVEAVRGYRADGRLGHLPPLDGIRGLGIPFVLLYHHGAELVGVRFGGGFLTVSMFFTLSGFLITRLLVDEATRTRTIDVRRFYARRFRRLMPAALAVLALIALFWAVFPTRGRSLSIGSFLSSLFYSQNLYLRWQGKGYSQIFAERSPLQHMWSLSLEEQIYAVFPLLLVAVFRASRARNTSAACWRSSPSPASAPPPCSRGGAATSRRTTPPRPGRASSCSAPPSPSTG